MKLAPSQEKVSIKWFVWNGGKRYERNNEIKWGQGYDFACSCGYESRTGGAVKSYVRDLIDRHKIEDHGYQTEYSYKSISGEIVKI